MPRFFFSIYGIITRSRKFTIGRINNNGHEWKVQGGPNGRLFNTFPSRQCCFTSSVVVWCRRSTASTGGGAGGWGQRVTSEVVVRVDGVQFLVDGSGSTRVHYTMGVALFRRSIAD